MTCRLKKKGGGKGGGIALGPALFRKGGEEGGRHMLHEHRRKRTREKKKKKGKQGDALSRAACAQKKEKKKKDVLNSAGQGQIGNRGEKKKREGNFLILLFRSLQQHAETGEKRKGKKRHYGLKEEKGVKISYQPGAVLLMGGKERGGIPDPNAGTVRHVIIEGGVGCRSFMCCGPKEREKGEKG